MFCRQWQQQPLPFSTCVRNSVRHPLCAAAGACCTVRREDRSTALHTQHNGKAKQLSANAPLSDKTSRITKTRQNPQANVRRTVLYAHGGKEESDLANHKPTLSARASKKLEVVHCSLSCITDKLTPQHTTPPLVPASCLLPMALQPMTVATHAHLHAPSNSTQQPYLPSHRNLLPASAAATGPETATQQGAPHDAWLHVKKQSPHSQHALLRIVIRVTLSQQAAHSSFTLSLFTLCLKQSLAQSLSRVMHRLLPHSALQTPPGLPTPASPHKHNPSLQLPLAPFSLWTNTKTHLSRPANDATGTH
jgi:hypothetical protein